MTKGVIDNQYKREVMSFSFYMNRDKTLVQRNVYSLLDLLSDIGGIQGLILSLFALVISLVNTERFEEHLIGQLFAYKAVPKKKRRPTEGWNVGITQYFR